MTDTNDQLALSAALTLKTNQLCIGLESGTAEIFELVTPTTGELLNWWFGEDMVLARGGTTGVNPGGLNFHTGQKQAILNAIVAHEVLGQGHDQWSLLDLYRAAAPDALLAGTRLNEVAQDKHAHPKYCFKMATGTGNSLEVLDRRYARGNVLEFLAGLPELMVCRTKAWAKTT